MLPDKTITQTQTINLKAYNDLLLLCLLVVFGFIVPLLGYAVLPMLNITVFESLFSLGKVSKLSFLVVGGISYYFYLKYITRHPFWLMLFYVVLWPIIEYVNNLLLVYAGLNIHLRPLLILAVSLPILIMGFKYRQYLWENLPHLKYYGAFCSVLLLYFLFYNANASDNFGGAVNVWSEGNIGLRQLIAYFHCLAGIMLGAICMVFYKDSEKRFDRLNLWLLIISSIITVLTIVSFPLGISGTSVDGFYRAHGIFTHANPYSHHMGILLIYFLGLFCYYQEHKDTRLPSWLLNMGILIHLIGFLLGLSKTAIAAFMASILLMVIMNFSSAQLRPIFSKIFIWLLILTPFGLWLFEGVAGQSFFQVLQSRIEQQQSLTWRTEVWDALWSDLNLSNIMLGHGFTAANDRVFQLTYHNVNNARPLMMVHNGYLALIYDIGLLGWLLFVAAVSLFLTALKRFHMPLLRMERPLFSSIAAMSLYFLLVCGFDEMTYMFDAPILFWTLSTMLLTRFKPVGRGSWT